MIQREENTTYIATISGGKDSVTMCDLLLKNGYPVDEIIFNDTLEEFKEMYDYIEKLKDYFFMRYDKKITILKPNKTFDYWCNGIITKKKSKAIGSIRGLPSKGGMCYWRRESKVNTSERYLKKKYKNNKLVQYIGYTLGEDRIINDTKNVKFLYPLQDIFKMKEDDCKKYLVNQEMENPLYRHFNRTGCAICPFQSNKSWFNVWKYYPTMWELAKKRENNLNYLEKKGYKIINKYWFIGHKTCFDMEKIFIEADKQGSLFDFSDEPLKDCFCKI